MTIEAIKVNVTFHTVTLESAECGEYTDSGFIVENMEFGNFADMVRYLRNASVSPLISDTMNENVWFSNDIEDCTTVEETTYCIHPCNDRTARYLFKALRVASR